MSTIMQSRIRKHKQESIDREQKRKEQKRKTIDQLTRQGMINLDLNKRTHLRQGASFLPAMTKAKEFKKRYGK